MTGYDVITLGEAMAFCTVRGRCAWADRVLHVTGITPALGREPAAAVAHAVRLAAGRSVTVCLDVDYRAKLRDREAAGASHGASHGASQGDRHGLPDRAELSLLTLPGGETVR